MASDKTASATVPIDEDIQRFAIQLDESDGSWMLPILEDLVECFKEIDDSGENGVEMHKLAGDSKLPLDEFLEKLAHDTEIFEETTDKSIRLNSEVDSPNANLILGD